MSRRYITTEERQLVTERAQNSCEYCRSQAIYATASFVIEHIVPVSKGGKTETVNLAFACSGCNAHKYNKMDAMDPVDGKTVPLFHPRQDKWGDHFTWNQSFTEVIGLTPTGRATVRALLLNRSGLVNMRTLLRASGKHPPT
jgi:hypothetical protein